MTFDHERLDVYRCALDTLDCCDLVLEQMPPGRAHFRDQLDRAATSVVLNIAEGAGEFSRAKKRRFYRMALRSATECAAILHIVDRRGHVPHAVTAEARTLLRRVVSMLVRMIKGGPEVEQDMPSSSCRVGPGRCPGCLGEQPGRGTGTGTCTNGVAGFRESFPAVVLASVETTRNGCGDGVSAVRTRSRSRSPSRPLPQATGGNGRVRVAGRTNSPPPRAPCALSHTGHEVALALRPPLHIQCPLLCRDCCDG